MSQTERQIAGNQRRTLRAMRERLLEMAKAWEDVDGYNQTMLTDLSDAVDSTASQLVVDDSDTDRT